jgi:hypothetical protein
VTRTKLLREVSRMNELMGSELGRNPFGEPVYAWKWSEDLLHPMAVVEESDTGVRPVLDYIADPESGLIVASQRFVLRKECLTLQDQWVLCKWIAPMDPVEWRKTFGHSLEWDSRGSYAPISASGSGNYASLNPGERPTDAITWQAIRTIRANLAVDRRAEDYEISRRQDAKETSLRDQIAAEIQELGQIAGRPWMPNRGDRDYSIGGFGPPERLQ